MKSYYVKMNGKTLGPLDLGKMRALVHKGRLDPKSSISIDGKKWQSASLHLEIFSNNDDLSAVDDENSPFGQENNLPAFEIPVLPTPSSEAGGAVEGASVRQIWQPSTAAYSNPQQSPNTSAYRGSDEDVLKKYVKSDNQQDETSIISNNSLDEKVFHFLIIGVMILLVIIPSFMVLFWMVNRNGSFRNALSKCPSSRTVKADVYYKDWTNNSSIVFTVKTKDSSGARTIDALHLLFEFFKEVDINRIDTVYLGRNARFRYKISGDDLKFLVKNYNSGRTEAAILNFPEAVLTLKGDRAFSSWSGGTIAVLNKKTEQLNEMLDVWLID